MTKKFRSIFFDLFADPLNPDDLEVARYVESRHGNMNLVDRAGHVFQMNHRNRTGKKIYWTCEYKRQNKRFQEDKCTARATTVGIHVLAWTGEHNHEVNDHQFKN